MFEYHVHVYIILYICKLYTINPWRLEWGNRAQFKNVYRDHESGIMDETGMPGESHRLLQVLHAI